MRKREAAQLLVDDRERTDAVQVPVAEALDLDRAVLARLADAEVGRADVVLLLGDEGSDLGERLLGEVLQPD